MDHVLDNPAWNALISGNQSLALGTETVKFFPDDVAPFVGFREYSYENFEMLFQILKNKRQCAFISSSEIIFPSSWKIKERFNVLQMFYNKPTSPVIENKNIVTLGNHNIEEMIELTRLTHPGPFKESTIAFGHYEGIFEDGNLIAMAGQRLHPRQYTEISAVCTHPDYTKKGLASLLILSQVSRMLSSSQIPFLHVLSDNIKAIQLYYNLGFVKRSDINIYLAEKNM
ncbi:MAG: GNAT family N-acetyltransferase [Ginsengibacter sp.]